MKLKNAGLATKEEAMHKMIDGAEFYYNGNKLFLEEGCLGIQTFSTTYAHPDLHTQLIKKQWYYVQDWQVPVTWKDDLPVLCWVWDNIGERECRVIETIKDYYYLDREDVPWKYAEPVKPEDCYD